MNGAQLRKELDRIYRSYDTACAEIVGELLEGHASCNADDCDTINRIYHIMKNHYMGLEDVNQ